MSTQKQKFELFARLQEMGFTYEESAQLRRIEMTLHRWDELECGVDGHAPQSTLAIERDENEKPFMRSMGPGYGGQWIDRKWPVADREAGARRRLAAIMDRHRELVAYVQGDCRGAALYIVRRSDLIQDGKPLPIDSCYNRGLCVAA